MSSPSNRLTISQMAHLNGVSDQMLRLYDRMGLLHASEKGRENGYRYYNIKQSARLDMIQYMKSLGMSLRDIREHLDSGDLLRIAAGLRKKNEQIEHDLRELTRQKWAIERTISDLERYVNAPPDGRIVLEYIPARSIFCIQSGINFYDHGIETYEKILRSLKKSLRSHDLPEIYFWNAGTIMRKEHLQQREFISTEVFVLVERELTDPGLLQTIPAGYFLCIYCDRFEKEKEYVLRLLDAVEKQHCIIHGDYICEVIFESPVPNGSERGMFLRLQIPVQFC